MKKCSDKRVCKRELMEQTGLCSYSVHKWRTLYNKGVLESSAFNFFMPYTLEC